MKYTPKGIYNYLSYLRTYEMQRESTVLLQHVSNYDFELEHKLVEQCEAGDFIHAVESPVRGYE